MPEIDDLSRKIDTLTKLVEENNEKINSLHRGMVMGRIWRIVYWTVIIGTAIGAFYLFQPYIDSLLEVYGQVNEAQSSFESLLAP